MINRYIIKLAYIHNIKIKLDFYNVITIELDLLRTVSLPEYVWRERFAKNIICFTKYARVGN